MKLKQTFQDKWKNPTPLPESLPDPASIKWTGLKPPPDSDHAKLLRYYMGIEAPMPKLDGGLRDAYERYRTVIAAIDSVHQRRKDGTWPLKATDYQLPCAFMSNSTWNNYAGFRMVSGNCLC
jgi:hypothetical protein